MPSELSDKRLRWLSLAIVAASLSIVRLPIRTAQELSKPRADERRLDLHERALAPYSTLLPPGTVVGYLPRTGTYAEFVPDFDKARYFLVPLRVIRSTEPDWVFVSIRGGDEPAAEARAAGMTRVDVELGDGFQLFHRGELANSLNLTAAPRPQVTIAGVALCSAAAAAAWWFGVELAAWLLGITIGPRGEARWFVMALGIPLGWWSAGAAFLLRRLSGGAADLRYAIGEAAVFGVAAFLLHVARRRRSRVEPSLVPEVAGAATRGLRWQRAVAAALIAVSVAGFCYFVLFFAWQPLASDDALAMFNLKARVLLSAGDVWQDFFTVRQPGNVEYCMAAEYPLGLPSVVARLWNALGAPAYFVPQLVAGAVTMCCMVITASLVRRRAGLLDAALASLVLLGSAAFLQSGASQYADLPVGLALLATVACLEWSSEAVKPRGHLLLAGLFAGIGVFTKNEGWVDLVCLSIGRGAWIAYRRGLRIAVREVGWLLVGASLFAAVTLLQKSTLAAKPILIHDNSTTRMLEVLLDPKRLATVGRYFAAEALNIAKAWAILLPIYAVVRGLAERRSRDGLTGTAIAAVLFVAALYLVFVASPFPLEAHLGSSARRVLGHWWPTLIAVLFASLRPTSAGNDPEAPLAGEPAIRP